MNVWLKLSLGVVASLLLSGCQGQGEKKAVDFPAENQLLLLTTNPRDMSDHLQNYRFSYHVPGEQKKLILWQEVYRDGQLSTRQEALTLAHVDEKGYISLELSLNPKESYQVTLQVEGLEKHFGALTFHVPMSQQEEMLATAQVTLSAKLLRANVRQPLFGLKFSPEEESHTLSNEFINEPEQHLSDLTAEDVVYIYHCEFITD